MSEQDLRDSLQQAVWDEPPLDFDPDTFMARAEQLTRRRRALMSVGVATALIIATVATLPAFLTSGRNRVESATGVSTTSSATTPSTLNFPWPPNDVKRRGHTYLEDQPFLASMWEVVISPALQHEGAEVSSIGTWSPDFQPSAYARDRSVNDILMGSVDYVGPTGAAQLNITLAGPGGWGPTPEGMCRNLPDPSTCSPVKRPDGSVVVAVELGGKTGSGGFYTGERTVYHYRKDGSVVGMTSRPRLADPNAALGVSVPMNFDQLTRLATNESITLPN
ncbi:hypothetical protein [Umezawaea sp. NPDC059074]|uniref:hypothetical protein n=1 Tax=Umezawaea sp. NPDC059074 TaxID=3346716 RepID=UPI00367BAA74